MLNSTLASAINSGLSDAGDSFQGLIATNAPIIIGVVVAVAALGFGLKLLRKAVGR